MESNESGADSGMETDIENCSNSGFNERPESPEAADNVMRNMALVPYVEPVPFINQVCGFELNCVSESAVPSASTSSDMFQSCQAPIQEYKEMLDEMEKDKDTTQTNKETGAFRFRTRHRFHNLLEKNIHKLFRATSVNNTELLEKLLQQGLDPNCLDYGKRTPLHMAAEKGHFEAVEMLLKYGANPNMKDSMGCNPLHLAATTNHVELVTLLLKRGTDVSSRDYLGRSPLHLAQTKLNELKQCRSDDAMEVKRSVLVVIDMLIAYFSKKKNSKDEAELMFNEFQRKLQLSDSGETISNEVQRLLDDLSSMKL